MENIYCIKNILSNRNANGGLYLFPTDTMASVVLAEAIVKGSKDKLEELQLWKIGTFEDTALKTTIIEPVLIEWDLRRLKEQKMENKTKEEVIADLSDK